VNAKNSIDAQYNEIFRRDKVDQDNPTGLPIGFHYIKTSQRSVLGFYCAKCKLQIIGAPNRVKHCGTESRMPTGRFAKLITKLKTYRVKRYR
jgi:hypothetical protein